jgi:hypothetical protein
MATSSGAEPIPGSSSLQQHANIAHLPIYSYPIPIEQPIEDERSIGETDQRINKWFDRIGRAGTQFDIAIQLHEF